MKKYKIKKYGDGHLKAYRGFRKFIFFYYPVTGYLGSKKEVERQLGI